MESTSIARNGECQERDTTDAKQLAGAALVGNRDGFSLLVDGDCEVSLDPATKKRQAQYTASPALKVGTPRSVAKENGRQTHHLASLASPKQEIDALSEHQLHSVKIGMQGDREREQRSPPHLGVEKVRCDEELEEEEAKARQGDMNFLMKKLMEKNFDEKLRKFVESHTFDYAVLGIIFLNCLTIAQETEQCQHGWLHCW